MNNKQVTDIANLYKSIYEEEGVKAYASIQSEATMAPREHKKPTPTVPSTNPKPKDPPKGTSLGPKDVRMESMVGGRGLPSPSSGSAGSSLLDRVRSTAVKVGGDYGAAEAKRRHPGNILGIPERVGRNRGKQTAGKAFDQVTTGNVGGALNTVLDALRETKDSFDIVKGHLIDEGYADTEEAALVIMANMSEEWRQSIVEAEVLAMKNGVPGSVKVRPALSIPGTDIGIGPNRPVKGTFTTTTPEQRAKIKSGDTHIDRGVGGMQSRQGAGPTQNERRRYNAQLTKQNNHNAPRMPL